ncbi:MAG: FAD-binding protein [Cytophagia bacterium]|nr:FAD-binding protein [Cytophagia bacterium]
MCSVWAFGVQFWVKMSVHEIYLNPAEAYAPQTLGYPNLQALMEDRYAQEISGGGLTILRRSVDARGSGARALIRFAASSSMEAMKVQGLPFVPQILSPNSPELHIVGAGPAGIFAALRCLEHGWRPIVVERGQAIRERRRDVAVLSRDGHLNPDSNYCFGEGGAGTFSDGKLYTRSTKRGDINAVLRLLIELGAPPEIAFEAHPHIGTNKLPALIQTARQWIEAAGGRFHFGCRVEDLDFDKSVVKALVLQDGQRMPLNYMMLCTGHSARDVYEMLDRCGLSLEPKALAMGVRLEHPQELVNKWRYRLRGETPPHWPVASYSVVEQVGGKGVYTFCMCPGGIMAPCATNPSEVVTNGWSPSRRNNGTANSGWVTEIGLTDVPLDKARPAFSLLNFQQNIERRAAEMGGGHQWAPAQRIQDFASPSESRTSSPIRIPRLDTLLHHPQCANLFPVGEGAGYAGGIMSAILDARRSVDALIQQATHVGSSIR